MNTLMINHIYKFTNSQIYFNDNDDRLTITIPFDQISMHRAMIIFSDIEKVEITDDSTGKSTIIEKAYTCMGISVQDDNIIINCVQTK